MDLHTFYIWTESSRGELEVIIAPNKVSEGRYGYSALIAATAQLSQTEPWQFRIRAKSGVVHDVTLTLAQTQKLREKLGEIARQNDEILAGGSVSEAVNPPEQSRLSRLPLIGRLFRGETQ
ncbi:hypothetical protein KA012_03275 [Candidatus Woesebacteria bacterium]|nr:hypothetical protein [Candidatus Woesebacteria bacterium]